MVDDKDLKLNTPESEKIIREKKEERGEKIEEPVLGPEKERSPEIQPGDKEKVLDEIEQFEKEEKGGLAGVSDSGQKSKEREKQIEKILEADLEDIYLNLPADKQQEFKKEGEETIKEINTLLDKAKLKIKKIVDLIKKWLSLIPGVNKFFLEQEAKIKADEIIKLRER